jgi:hypothetical protein
VTMVFNCFAILFMEFKGAITVIFHCENNLSFENTVINLQNGGNT